MVFQYINLPSPTEIQYAIADELQYRESDLILNGFRGVAKSTITGIYVAWLFFKDPVNTQIIYVGANQEEAKKFMKFTRGLFEIVPFLNFLIPDVKAGQRDNALAFDVAPAGVRIQPSCRAVGIFGSLTGSRATHIIADDIETSENCDTQVKREHIESAVTEFRQIVSPFKDGNLLFLGTPHTEISIYNKLYNKGIPIRIFPIKYPTEQQQEKYGDKLAPYIANRVQLDPTLIGQSTDPLRFGDDMILKLEAEGRSKFAMQQMLDTTLSDMERYPLKCSDLIIMDCNKEIAPEKVAYGSAANQVIKDLPCNGIGTDRYYSPIPLPDIKWLPYNYLMMAIDPSGRGKDELACPNFIHSLDAACLMLYLVKCKKENIDSFITVHDCYGTLAPDTDMSAKLLREAFVEIYRQPILENFTEDVLSGLELNEEEIPEIPEKGSLDIEEVLNSDYFFN